MSYGNPYQSNPYSQAPSNEAGYAYGQVSPDLVVAGAAEPCMRQR